jgi:hypothetical protein
MPSLSTSNFCPALFLTLLLIGCQSKFSTEEQVEPRQFDQALADELKTLAEIDQVAAYIPQGEYTKLSDEEWNSFKDSVFRANQTRAAQIFEKYGFIGYDLAGEAGSADFWLLIQHSDHAPNFQSAVLEKMKIEVDRRNADSNTYGLLVDRVNLNTGKPQVYGTQVTYDMEIGKAFPINLGDSASVNVRRKVLGMESLESYLNDMTEMHFMMNKGYYSEKGITSPSFYPIEKQP